MYLFFYFFFFWYLLACLLVVGLQCFGFQGDNTNAAAAATTVGSGNNDMGSGGGRGDDSTTAISPSSPTGKGVEVEVADNNAAIPPPISHSSSSSSSSQPRSHSVETPEDVSPPGEDSETLTFHVQLNNDTGRAGLGVSVKGKTETTGGGLRDLGIFVNSILSGGAAYKVCLLVGLCHVD